MTKRSEWYYTMSLAFKWSMKQFSNGGHSLKVVSTLEHSFETTVMHSYSICNKPLF